MTELRIGPLDDAVEVRRPGPGEATELGAAAHAADERLVAAARARLARDLPALAPRPAAPDDQPTLGPAGWASALDPEAVVDAAVAEHRDSQVVAAPGTNPDPEDFRRPATAAAALRAPLLARWPAPSPVLAELADLADDLATATDAATTITAYVGGEGFPVPTALDRPRLLLAGHRPVEVALAPPRARPDAPPAWAGSLAVGDALHLPAGWTATVVADRTWWAEVEVAPPPADWVAAEVARRLARRHPLVRASLPYHPEDDSPLTRLLARLDLDGERAIAAVAHGARVRACRPVTAADAARLLAGAATPRVLGPLGWYLVEHLHPDDPPLAAGEAAVAVGGRLLRAPTDLLHRLLAGVVDPGLVDGLVRAELVAPATP